MEEETFHAVGRLFGGASRDRTCYITLRIIKKGQKIRNQIWKSIRSRLKANIVLVFKEGEDLLQDATVTYFKQENGCMC